MAPGAPPASSSRSPRAPRFRSRRQGGGEAHEAPAGAQQAAQQLADLRGGDHVALVRDEQALKKKTGGAGGVSCAPKVVNMIFLSYIIFVPRCIPYVAFLGN